MDAMFGRSNGVVPNDYTPLQRISTVDGSMDGEDDDTSELSFDGVGEDVFGGSEGIDPPVDGGRWAWTVLLACWVVDFMTSGPSPSVAFGLFSESYLSNPLFKSNGRGIPSIGTLLSGLAWLATPLTNYLVLRYPQYKMRMLWIGWLLCVSGLIMASFSSHVWQLQLFQGVMYGVGWVVYWSPMLVIVNEWWFERRGMAYGIWFTASNVCGFIMPFVIQNLLHRWDFRITLRLYAIAMLVVAGPALMAIKPRQTLTHYRATTSPSLAPKTIPILLPLHHLKNPQFHLYTLAISLQSLVYIIPSLYLPLMCSALALPASTASTLLALTNLSTIPGQALFGHYSDKKHPWILMTASTLACALSSYFLLGSATTLGGLGMFAVVWGFFGLSYDVVFARVCGVLSLDAEEALTLYGFLSFERGIAVLLQGPVSAALVGSDEVKGMDKYDGLVSLCSWCMFASALCGLAWFRTS